MFFFIGDKPKLQHLQLLKYRGGQVRIIDETSSQWPDVAIALGFEGYSISQIELSSQRQAKEACRTMIMEWLKGAKRTPVTWNTLVQALIDAKFVDLAEQLQTVLRR